MPNRRSSDFLVSDPETYPPQWAQDIQADLAEFIEQAGGEENISITIERKKKS